MRRKKQLLVGILAVILLMLSGCFGVSLEELYSLPEPAVEYLQLQSLIDAEIAGGCEYAAPIGGSYRQSVQLIDLDNDDTDEAFAFLRDADQNLRICVYCATNGVYSQTLVIEGHGTSISSVEYADLTGSGVSELLVSWQIGSGLRMLCVYSMEGWGGNQLLTVDCTEFTVCDMDVSGNVELLAIRFDAAEGGVVDMFSFSGNGEAILSSALFSTGVRSIERIRIGTLAEDMPVLYIESKYEEGWLVTDLFVSRRGRLKNLSQDMNSGISNTLRRDNIYCFDVDDDNYIEIPVPVSLYPQSDGASHAAITWYGYDSAGIRTLDVSTYHNQSDGWYLLLKESWRENLSVRREEGASGERTVILSTADPQTGEIRDFLAIYTLTGENRRERAQLHGRFLLRDESTTLYAAKILSPSDDPNDPNAFTAEDVKANFRLIYSEWMTSLTN